MTRRLFVITLLLLAASTVRAADPTAWKAGAAKVNITPDQLMWLSGYAGRKSPAEGTLHPLFARALALEDPAGNRAALVSMDLVGIPRPLSRDVWADAYGYACHATVLDGQRWSGDYPGCASADLEQDHPGAVALFWAGCGGDQNPLPRRKVELAEGYGRRLADSVEAVLKGSMKP